MVFIDISGNKYGRLKVLEKADKSKGQIRWLCKCDCGKETIVQGGHLREGNTTSCGCFANEILGNRVRTHGAKGTPEYKTWLAMNARCNNPNTSNYDHYGGRGVLVCDRWTNFENFYQDMGPRPEGTTIDRENSNGNYEPGNCRWATSTEQARNKRNTRLLMVDGKQVPLVEECEKLGVSSQLVYRRMKRGMSFEKAVNKPSPTQREESISFFSDTSILDMFFGQKNIYEVVSTFNES